MISLDFNEANFIPTLDNGLLSTSIMPIVHVVGGRARAIGTCFAISSDGLCLTARHVIEDALPGAFHERRQVNEREGWLYALYVSREPNEDNPEHFTGGLLPVQRAHFNGVLDIAAVQLQPAQNARTGELLRMPVNRLGFAPPRVGEFCFALGYHSMEWQGFDPNYEVAQSFYASRGQIEEVHVPRRDTVMAPFPCFRTSARYDGGMSGGPIISMDGLVVGVVCSSMDTVADADGFISYASLIGPAALLQISRLNAEGVETTYFINDLAERNIISVDYQGVSFERLDNELCLRIGGGTISSVIGT